ncbi:MAG: MFS transporter [Alcaligenaceae bacterium]|nr:MFS transporter [Alcaligenaceae bacterium]
MAKMTNTATTNKEQSADPVSAQAATIPILVSLSFCHFLNDLIQSLIPALYPLLKSEFSLDFTQIGIITLAFQLTASLLQPTVGFYTDKNPMPFSLAIGMGSTLIGLLLLAVAPSYAMILIAAGLIGTGSAIFHPEASRVARMASGGKFGSAQAFFQVGGNVGQAVGPLLAAFIVLPHGQTAIAWVSLAALIAIVFLTRIGKWYGAHIKPSNKSTTTASANPASDLPRARMLFLITILMLLLFSKNVYSASLTSFFTFYLIERFDLPVQAAQVQLFIFMAAIAIGTLIGGALTDRLGRRPMIWISILGTLPFTLALPYADLFWTGVLTIIIGLLMASAFPAILVFAHEVMPGRVGFVSGMFFGFSFGLGGLGAAVMGWLADLNGMSFVYQLCSFLPILGLVACFLPDMVAERRKYQHAH